jgi:hypothetical protein
MFVAMDYYSMIRQNFCKLNSKYKRTNPELIGLYAFMIMAKIERSS